LAPPPGHPGHLGARSRREAEPARTLATQWTGTGAGDGGARPARGDRYGWAGATRDGSGGATVTTTGAAAATTGLTTAGECCAAMQVAQDPAARRSRCVCALAATGTVSNATISSAPVRRAARCRMLRMFRRSS